MAEDVSAQVKAARFCASLCLMSLLVLLIVLVIDNQIKRDLMAKVAEARSIVDGFGVLYGQVMNGGQGQAAGVGGTDPDPGVSGGDGPDDLVQHAPGAEADGDPGSETAHVPFPKRESIPGGPRGDGRGTGGA